MLVLLISTKVYKSCSSTKLRDQLFRFKIAISRRCSRLQSSFPLRQSLWNRRKSHIMACLCRHYDLPAGPAQTRKFSRHASGGNFDGEELSFRAQSLVLGSEISRESPTPAGFGGADLVTGFRAKWSINTQISCNDLSNESMGRDGGQGGRGEGGGVGWMAKTSLNVTGRRKATFCLPMRGRNKEMSICLLSCWLVSWFSPASARCLVVCFRYRDPNYFLWPNAASQRYIKRPYTLILMIDFVAVLV